MHHTQRPTSPSHPFILALVCALSACGGTEQPSGSDPGTVQKAGDQGAMAGLRLPQQAVTAWELGCVTREFKGQVHWGTPAAHDTIELRTLRFTVESYRIQAAELVCLPEQTPGLVVHFGADAPNKTLSLAYSFVCMDLDSIDEGRYVLDDKICLTDANDELDGSNMTLADWRSTIGKTFQDNIVVDKYDHDRFQYIYKDVDGHMVFKLRQIDDLIRDNALAATDHIEVVPIAEPLTWPKTDRGADFTMRVCLVALKGNVRQISDAPQGAGDGRFTKRGSDLGSACPPLCDVVAFASSGVEVRKSCQ